jgi:hypothetical protein
MPRRWNRDRLKEDPVRRSIREIGQIFHPHGWIGFLAILVSLVVFGVSMDAMGSIGPGLAFGFYFSGLGIIVLLSILVLIVVSVPTSESRLVGWYKPFVWSSFSALAVLCIIWLALFRSITTTTTTRPGRHDQGPNRLQPAETPTPARPNPPHAQGIWLGFANEAGSLERNAELRARCGDFRRVYVPPGAGNMFTDLCNQEDKTCERVCDWEGRVFPCSAVSQGGRRDGSRVVLCR